MAEGSVTPYSFTDSFERVLVGLLATSPHFYALVGNEIESDAMPTSTGKLAMEAIQSIATDTGGGPGSGLIVVQRLRRWMDEGRVTRDEMDEVDDMIADAEDEGLPASADVLAELVPTLKRRLQNKAIKLAMDRYAKRSGMDEVQRMLDRAESIGRSESGLGVKLGGAASFQAIEELRHIDRCPTSVSEIDVEIGGGLPRGQLGMFIADPGGCKSMMLSQVGAFCQRVGLNVAVCTLELPVPIVLARIKANHTGVPIDAILAGDLEAQQKLAEKPPLGNLWVKELTPQISTPEDVRTWIDELEQSMGKPIDVVVIDYADKLTIAGVGKQNSQYQVMMHVYEDLRVLVHTGKKWGWTASQSTGRGKRKRKGSIDLEDVSDSIHKVRVVDLAISLNPEDDEIVFFVGKNRTGKSQMTVGPLPMHLHVGCVAPSPEITGNPAEWLLSRTVERSLGGGEELPF